MAHLHDVHLVSIFGVDWIQTDAETPKEQQLIALSLDLSGKSWRCALSLENAQWLHAQLEETLTNIDSYLDRQGPDH